MKLIFSITKHLDGTHTAQWFETDGITYSEFLEEEEITEQKYNVLKDLFQPENKCKPEPTLFIEAWNRAQSDPQ